MQKTEALYQKDASLQTHETTISSITPVSDLPQDLQTLFKTLESGQPYVVTTPQTIFHAQGGGQPTDTGSIILSHSGEEAVFKVHQVRKADPAILHMGTFTPADSTLKIGQEVKQVVDWGSRVLNSRLHTAGHVLGLAIRSLSRTGVLPADLKEVKASHYPGAAFVEFQGLIAGDKKSAMQEKVDELVRQDLDVTIHFWSEEEAKERCAVVLEGVKGGEEGVRVVEVGGLGSYPCGGTHVQRLRELGRVVVRNVKRQKGISKVSYEVVEA
ncbi:alanyl-tRNA synthetase-like protein [Lophiotrema nucula]|uniref:Alanyl-tRNA synthetase-like protein n=1 Tax=Lophiotrema nucula TaxID=690887 RepID=A0A6A5ZIT3_9PLEO|nr:alanyl-tRNA synthetase-like protein [Lophiotrema nucula]